MSHPKPTVDLGYPTEVRGRIPAFNSVEEEAAFWETHDVTEFVGQDLQPTEVTVGPDLADRLAKAKGVSPSALARMWLKERRRQEGDAAPQSR